MTTTEQCGPFSNAFDAPFIDPSCVVDPDHCQTCCPWYPQPCKGEFGEGFGEGFNCQHGSCVTLAGPEVGDGLIHGCEYPWQCLPWQADMACCDDWPNLDKDLRLRATTLAWNTMKSLTAGRVASGCTTLRPCYTPSTCNECYGSPDLLNPQLINGEWYNWPSCRDDNCSCCSICEIELPGRVAALLEVNIDGYRHDPRLFRIDNGNQLVRQDGCCFPQCQNMGAPYGYYGTFGIKYVPGVVPAADGRWAVGVLACEYAKACTGGKCRLPSAITSLSRQGVTMEFPRTMFEFGTGIREVDAYIYSINPNRLKVAPQVWSPDLPKHRVTTGQPRGIWP